MIGKGIHPEETFCILGIPRSMSDQEQSDKVEKCLLFGVIDLQSFKPQRNRIEQFLIADTNSHQGGIYGTYVTTHRISARTLAQVQKVCRPDFRRTGVGATFGVRRRNGQLRRHVAFRADGERCRRRAVWRSRTGVPFLDEVMRNFLQKSRRALKPVVGRRVYPKARISQIKLIFRAGGGDIEQTPLFFKRIR